METLSYLKASALGGLGSNPEKMPRGRFWKVLEGLDTLLGEVKKEEGQRQVTPYRLHTGQGVEGEFCIRGGLWTEEVFPENWGKRVT